MSSVILTNWTVYYADDAAAGAGMKQIKWTGTTGTTSVNALYAALMDLFDNASQNNYFDSIPMKAITPTLYEIGSSDAGDRQPWFIDPDSVTHLTGAGLNTAKWTRDTSARTGSHGIYKLTFTSTTIVASDIGDTITCGSVTGRLLHVAGSNLWVRPSSELVGQDWPSTGTATVSGSSHTATLTTGTVSAESVWSNIYTLGTIEANTAIYVYQNASPLSSWWTTGHIDVLVLVKDFSATPIDSGLLTIYARQYGKLYDHSIVTVATGGRTPVPLATAPDLNNATSAVTVSGYNNITITFGSITRDIGNVNGLQPYDVEIDCGTSPNRTLAQVYEYLKYVTRETSVISINGANGEAYLAAQSSYTPVKTAPFGTFAGGKFFGARGVWLKNVASADANNYELIDADNDPQSPPQSITLTVGGLAIGDQVAVFQATGVGSNTINKNMFTIDSTQPLGAGVTEVRVSETIPNDTPGKTTGGWIRLVHRNGAGNIELEERLAFSGWSNTSQPSYSTFTVSSFNSTLDTSDTAYVPYLDVTADDITESVALIYTANRNITVRVRKSGILPFMTPSQITNSNLTIPATRNPDPNAV